MSNENGEGVKLSPEYLPDGLKDLLELRSLQAVTREPGFDDYAAGLRDRIRADLADHGVSVEDQARRYMEELRPVMELGLCTVLEVRHDVRQGRSGSPESQRTVQRKLGELSFHLSHTIILFIHEFENELPPDITAILRDYPRFTLPEIGEQNRRKATTTSDETEQTVEDVVVGLLSGGSTPLHVEGPIESIGPAAPEQERIGDEVPEPVASEEAQDSGQDGEDSDEDLEPESIGTDDESDHGTEPREPASEILPEQGPAVDEPEEEGVVEEEPPSPVTDTSQGVLGTVSGRESTDSEQPSEVEPSAEEAADTAELAKDNSDQTETEEKTPEVFDAVELIGIEPRSITGMDPSQVGLLERVVTVVNGEKVNLKPEDIYLLAAFTEAADQGKEWLKLSDYKDTPPMRAIINRRGLARPQSVIYNALQRLRGRVVKNNREAYIKHNGDNSPTGSRYMLSGSTDAISIYLPQKFAGSFGEAAIDDSSGEPDSDDNPGESKEGTEGKNLNNSGLELTPRELERMVDEFSDVKEERRFFAYLLSQSSGVPSAEIEECYRGDLRQFMTRLRFWGVKNKGEFEVDTGLESGSLQITRLDG